MDHYFVDDGANFKCSCSAEIPDVEALAKHYKENRKCKKCGGENLVPDPSAHYNDAVTPTGAPLFCRDCRK
jgi:hypothetical protein